MGNNKLSVKGFYDTWHIGKMKDWDHDDDLYHRHHRRRQT